MTWGSRRTFCTVVYLVDNEIDFLRFDYEEWFICPQCTPKPPSITSLKQTPHRKRGLTLYEKPAAEETYFYSTSCGFVPLLSMRPTNRPVF
jgi:hypothetical protein